MLLNSGQAGVSECYLLLTHRPAAKIVEHCKNVVGIDTLRIKLENGTKGVWVKWLIICYKGHILALGFKEVGTMQRTKLQISNTNSKDQCNFYTISNMYTSLQRKIKLRVKWQVSL